MEHWEELFYGGHRFVYDDTLFRPGTDSFLLSSLPRLKPGLRVCDLGCGTGLLGLLLLQRQPVLTVTGIDILPQAVALTRKAVRENNLTDRLQIVEGDLCQPRLPAGYCDLAVCNPPYYPPGSGLVSADHARRTARSETDCSLPELCRAAARVLRWGGSFCLVHKPERLADLCCTLREAGLEPKRLRLVSEKAAGVPSLVLLEARRGGRPGLAIEAPLILHTSDGLPTPELDAIYFRKQEDTL